MILFDYGGVVADHYSQPALSALAHLVGSSPQKILDELSEQKKHGRSYRLGQMSLPAFWARVRTNLRGPAFDCEEAQALWAATYVPNQAMLGLIGYLRDSLGIKTGLLLNNDRARLDHLWRHWPCVRLFDYIFSSSELGAVKPDPEFYQQVQTRCPEARQAGRVLVVDDRLTHVETPRKMGFQGHLFTGPGAFSLFISEMLALTGLELPAELCKDTGL